MRAMKALAVAGILLAACTTETDTTPIDVGMTVKEMCGPSPNAPGWVVSSNGDTVSMTRTDYAAIQAWQQQVSNWNYCVENL
jgi:hypothetical protein